MLDLTDCSAGWLHPSHQPYTMPSACRYQDQYPEMQVSIDCVVINDAYPKARCHGLVIARAQGLNGPADLREVHLPLLQAMQVRHHHHPATVI